MALTIESLKGLYEKLGGEDFGNVTTIPEAIDKVAEVAEGGSGGGGGGGDYILEGELILTGATPSIGEIQINVSELDEAIAANKNIKLVLSCDEPIEATLVLPFVETGSDSGFFFMGIIDFEYVNYVAKAYISRTNTEDQSFNIIPLSNQ